MSGAGLVQILHLTLFIGAIYFDMENRGGSSTRDASLSACSHNKFRMIGSRDLD